MSDPSQIRRPATKSYVVPLILVILSFGLEVIFISLTAKGIESETMAIYQGESILSMDCYYCVAYCTGGNEGLCCQVNQLTCQERLVTFSYDDGNYTCTWIDQSGSDTFQTNMSYSINIEGNGLCHPVDNTDAYTGVLIGITLFLISSITMIYIVMAIQKSIQTRQYQQQINADYLNNIGLHIASQGYFIPPNQTQ
jgi:hypothetical protein